MVDQFDSPPSDERRWHISMGGKKQGPFSDLEIAEFVAQGKFKPKDPAWRVGLPNWTQAQAIPELAYFFSTRRSLISDGPPAPPRPPSGLSLAWTVFRSRFQAMRVRLNERAARLRPIHFAALAAILAVPGGVWFWRTHLYTPPQDDLVSLYSAQSEGAAEEVAKIEKNGPIYFITLKQAGHWGTPEGLHLMGKTEYTELFGKEWRDARPLGLVNLNGQIALLKVKHGWSNGEFTCSTGYFLMRPSGPVEITKTEAKTLALPSLARKEPDPTRTPDVAASPKTDGTTKETDSARADESHTKTSATDEAGASTVAAGQTLGSLAPLVGPPEPPRTRGIGIADASGTGGGSLSQTEPDEATRASSPTNGKVPSTESVPMDRPTPVDAATLTESPPPKPSAKDSKKAVKVGAESGANAELQEARRKAADARKRLLEAEAPGMEARKEEVLKSVDATIDASKKQEERGDSKAALASARQALQGYQDGEKIFSHAPLAAAAPASPAPSGDGLKYTALNLAQNSFSPGETVKAIIRIDGMSRRTQFYRWDTVLIQSGGGYVPLAKPSGFDLGLDPVTGTVTTTFDISGERAPGLYRIHSDLFNRANDTAVAFQHDFDFQVSNPNYRPPATGQNGAKQADPLGDALNKLGNAIGGGHHSRHK